MSPLTRMIGINGVEVNQVTVMVDSSLPEPVLEGIAQVTLNNVSSTITYETVAAIPGPQTHHGVVLQ